MLPEVIENKQVMSAKQMQAASHVLVVLPRVEKADALAHIPLSASLIATLKRKRMELKALTTTPIAVDLAQGGLSAWVMWDERATTFEQHTALRKALALLSAEQPSEISVALFGDAQQRAAAASAAVYVAVLNSAALPMRKQKPKAEKVKRVIVYGHHAADAYAQVYAVAEGNTLTRALTMLPPNELTPAMYRAKIKKLAQAQGWKFEEFDLKRLKKMGAGAFVAVAQGSEEQDAAIVHLSYAPKSAKHKVALVGKGICFDTGGHNLKPAKYMQGMHEDMNGSAVALGILLAATRLKLKVGLDVWLAISQNHIGPLAYKQNDVVTALNGTTIEIVHTDAEGRMVLADTLTMAARAKPDAIFDFATLTGSMVAALGTRYSGVLSNSEALLGQAMNAGKASGERVSGFPLDADYEPALDSKIADIKQCTLEGGADHILAARLLLRFVEDRPWLHMDLSASNCEGGLGAVNSPVTGFGVAWGVAMLQSL